MTETLSNKQGEFLQAIQASQSVFLTGKAGTGKSFVVKRAMEELKAAKRRYMALAPTGIAANNIGGQTIHSAFSLRPFGVLDFDACNFLKTEKRRMMDAVECIFIDEVSMLRPDILDAINWTLKKNGCAGLDTKQLIFVGDLKQLPPVLDDNTRSVLYQQYDGEEFFHARIYRDIKPVTIELDEVLRQTDSEFIDNLNIVRDGGKSQYFKRFISAETSGVILAPYNVTVAKYNKDGLSKINSEEFVFTAHVEGNVKADEFNLESEVRIKHGAKIMYLVNSRDNPLINGTLGEFIYKPGRDSPYFIRVDGCDWAIERVEFTKNEYVFNKKLNELELKEIGSITQYPIKLAYALSIHKSQGLTFDEVTIDLTRPCFCKGQLYVALSRVRTPEGLRIITGGRGE